MLKSLFFILFSAGLCFGQQTEKVDFLEINARVEMDTVHFKVNGQVQVSFKALQDTDSVYLDAVNMTVKASQGSSFKITVEHDKLWITSNFQKGENYTAEFTYEAKPRQALYFVGFDSDLKDYPSQVWTQGQGKYTSHWLPSLDDMNDKLIFNITYLAPKNYEVIANGKLANTRSRLNHKSWSYEMKQPMSSYLVAFAMGDFKGTTTKSKKGTPLQLYLETRHSDKVKSTFQQHDAIFNFLENKININYPWQNFKQVAVRDFLYAGMENTTLNIFSEEFVVDEIGANDRSFVNVQAHELAHQWFGNLVTETSSKHHWLHEGFATFYALEAEREIFGEDYYYFKIYKTAEELKALSDAGKGQILVNTGGSSLTYYQKGAWALIILRGLVGDEVFDTTVENYLRKHAYENVTTEDFISEVELAFGQPLTDFRKRWLDQKAFQSRESLEFLKKNEFVQEYMKLAAFRETRLTLKQELLNEALDFPVNEYLGQEAVYQLNGEDLNLALPLYKQALNTNNLYVRQAVASSLKKVPKELKTAYESLLEDKSYLTIERALLHLWMSFPEKRSDYLDQTLAIGGFQDKNVKLLWLTLNLVTPDYQPEQKSAVFKALSSYTNPGYPYQIRQHAFGYLYQIDTFTEANYKDLMEGVFHPVWQFKKFSRELLDTLMESERHKKAILNLVDEFSLKEKTFFNNRY
ncbi:M1 family metallopeptidase [Psychroflexus sp. YR1-1]|uniref:Aminopeptidase N n=1 Tax=Psychroflexus aurantiacus TaxID=2709310 RepID=A0A6B3R445_9FLAO|nr:M1 family metallopeptidase [Psychroflexus aurantiacus]NEV93675.1 M1 family metallopeptidase [Psychroflexus aurantiacus]